jgi:hypothetical protein
MMELSERSEILHDYFSIAISFQNNYISISGASRNCCNANREIGRIGEVEGSLVKSFSAYIICQLPDQPEWRIDRLKIFIRQLRWWLKFTSVRIHLRLANWTDAELVRIQEITHSAPARITFEVRDPQALILHRIECLQALYSSEYDWGIMMDDDAVLYDTHHNSGSRLFEEIAANGSDAYAGVDVFFPINPAKHGFNKAWNEDPYLYGRHHVFRLNLDLKGSLFVVRNFIKDGRPPILPDANFQSHGEDTLFATEAVRRNYTVFECWNMVLRELPARSHFGSDPVLRLVSMEAGNEEIARMYRSFGLRMTAGSHLLDKEEFQRRCWGEKPKTIVVEKPTRASIAN